MSKSIEERLKDSFKYGGNSEYLNHLYEQYLNDPNTIKPEWKKYFDSIQNGATDVSHKDILSSLKNINFSTKDQTTVKTNSKSSDIQNLINAYRRRGHQVAKIDPLHLREHVKIPDLELEFHGLSNEDLNKEFSISNFQNNKKLKPVSYTHLTLPTIYSV